MSPIAIAPTHASRRTRSISRTTTKVLRRIILFGGLAFFTVWTVLPLYWIIATSVKTNTEIYSDASLIPRTLTAIHYDQLLNKTPFVTYFKNSLMVSSLTAASALVIGLLAAYAITRLNFRGRVAIARVTIVTYLVPGSLLFIPLFQIAFQLGLTNKAIGLPIIYLVGAVPFCTWLAISYFSVIPAELEEAALVDGANRLQAMVYITLPLALPAIAVIALYAFTNAWNEFLFALLLISSDSQKTIPAGLAGLINGDVFQWGGLMAGAVLASIPPVLLYMLAQRWVVS
ncbi:MAG: carbohydrate ABC transporter permease, partial [Chloroflexota bacterium]